MRDADRVSPSKLLKSYYSIGAMVYSIVLPAVAGGVWWVGARLFPSPLASEGAGLVISIISSFAVAYFVPEPYGYPDAGRRKLTKEERIPAIFGGVLTFMTLLGARCLVMGAST
jgi:hypothetical protein